MLLLLEHVNLHVTDDGVARAFYVDGLGCVANPARNPAQGLSTHINLGLSQFHLPLTATAQRLPGVIELATSEPLPTLAARLASVQARSQHRSVSAITTVDGDGEDGASQCLEVVGPFGNCFRVFAAKEDEVLAQRSAGTHPGGTHLMVRLRSVRLRCPLHSTLAVRAFYEELLFTPVHLAPGQPGLGKGAQTATVLFRSGQKIVFEEDPAFLQARPYDVDESQRFHVAVYLESEEQFEAAFERSEPLDLHFINPRFQGGPIEFASAASLQEARAAHQFRLKNMPKNICKQGCAWDVAFQFEHEVRSPEHVSFPLSAYEPPTHF